MGSHRLVENVDEVISFDNEVLHNICKTVLSDPAPCHASLNKLIGLVTSSLSSSLRYSGQLNVDLRKIAVNLVPFPRLHFFCPGFAPLVNDNHAEVTFLYSSYESKKSNHKFLKSLHC